MNRVKKAVIPVAGYGTRRLPITKSIEKCMLPILNRPIVDYVVQDCIQAGIIDICFVVGEESTQIRHYYSQNVQLESYLAQKGNLKGIDSIRIPHGVNFHFVTQPSDGKYGTALPVYYARDFIGDDSRVLVCMGDDFLWNSDGSSELGATIQSSDGASVVGVEIERSQVGRYGVFELGIDGSYVQIVEGPDPASAPSSLINVSKYVLTQDILSEIYRYCEAGEPSSRGEFFIIDPINSYVSSGGKLHVYPSKAMYLDGGTLEGWIHANNYMYTQVL
jgi:UTP--glucose-1-phosphate uridylyltransferase